jgi:ABC-2 type transport system permease protein
MFLKHLFLKNLRDKRAALFWWSFSFFLLNILVSSVFQSVAESAPDLEAYIESLPEALVAAFGIEEGMSIASAPGFLNAELFSLMIPIMFLVFAINFGSATIAGEEEAGTLGLLLSLPLPRWRVLLEKFLAMIIGIVLLALVTWVSLVVGVELFDMDISSGLLAAASANVALLGLTFGSISLAVGAATGRRGLAVAVGVALSAASYLLNILSGLVDSLQPYEAISPFYYYLNANPLVYGLQIGDVVVLVGVTLVFLVVALFAFERRDLAV